MFQNLLKIRLLVHICGSVLCVVITKHIPVVYIIYCHHYYILLQNMSLLHIVALMSSSLNKNIVAFISSSLQIAALCRHHCYIVPFMSSSLYVVAFLSSSLHTVAYLLLCRHHYI